MAYIVQKIHPSQKMQSIFHHSLIKMIVLHQLEQQGIPWEVFITHDVFKNPQPLPLQISPHNLIHLPPLLHHPPLTIIHPLHINPLPKQTSLFHLLLKHQNNKKLLKNMKKTVKKRNMVV